MHRRLLSSVVVATMLASTTLTAVDGKKAAYAGGTVTFREKAEGRLDTVNPERLIFTDDKTKDSIEIPYASIAELEYGQNAGRRVAMAVLVSPLALFSKKRNHYLTINYKDQAGADQAVVLELGKDISRTTLTIVETRSGKEIQYQDEESKKHRGK